MSAEERDEAIKAWARAQAEFAQVHEDLDQVAIDAALADVAEAEAELYRLANMPDPWAAFREKDGEAASDGTPAVAAPGAPQDDLTVAYMAGLERGKELALEPVDDHSDAYGELLAEWSGRRRLYGKYACLHPKLLREAMRQADELGRPLLGDVIQSLVWQDVIASNRAAHLAQHYACCAGTPEQPASDQEERGS